MKDTTSDVVSPYFLYNGSADKNKPNEIGVDSLFKVQGWGVATRKDYLLVDFSLSDLATKFDDIASLSREEARKKYSIKVSAHWDFDAAFASIQKPASRFIRTVTFRPWDERFIYYTVPMIERGDHRYSLMTHSFLPNLSLLTIRRQETGEKFEHVWVSNTLSVLHTVAAKEGSFHFPLYLYPPANSPQGAEPEAYRLPNFSEDFLKKLATALGTTRFLIKGYSTELSEMVGKDQMPPLPYDPATGQYHGLPHKVSPEDIFFYIYAILHSPDYRERYRDFLKIDFPRIPLPKGRELFEALIPLGRQLTALHLLDAENAPVLSENRHGFPVSGVNNVDENFGTKKHPSYEKSCVYINPTQYFKDVPATVWTHTIGGYQPAEKWLKDRRGRTLSTDDLRHYQRMLIAITETQSTMPQIDEIITTFGGFPEAFV